MQAVQKFAGGANSCSEDAMVTRGLLIIQPFQKSPISRISTLLWRIPHGAIIHSGILIVSCVMIDQNIARMSAVR
jgi:hypothetical protein